MAIPNARESADKKVITLNQILRHSDSAES